MQWTDWNAISLSDAAHRIGRRHEATKALANTGKEDAGDSLCPCPHS